VTQPKHEAPPDVPFGTLPRRSLAPLIVLILLFAIWFACLVWLAVRYPAR
jgi:hypothetical protein